MIKHNGQIIFEQPEEVELINKFAALLKNANREINNFPKNPGDMSTYIISFSEMIHQDGTLLTEPLVHMTIENDHILNEVFEDDNKSIH